MGLNPAATRTNPAGAGCDRDVVGRAPGRITPFEVLPVSVQLSAISFQPEHSARDMVFMTLRGLALRETVYLLPVQRADS